MSAPSFYVPSGFIDAVGPIYPSQLGFINNIGIIDDDRFEEFAKKLNNPIQLEQASVTAKGFLDSHLTKMRALIHVPDIRIKYGYQHGLIDLVIVVLALTEDGWTDSNLGRVVLGVDATLDDVLEYANRVVPVIETISFEQIEEYAKKGWLACYVSNLHSGGISLHLEHGAQDGELSVNNIPSFNVVEIVLKKHGLKNHAAHILSSRYAIHILNSRSLYDLLSSLIYDVATEVKSPEKTKSILSDLLASIGVSHVNFGELDPLCSEISDMMIEDAGDACSEISTFLNGVGGHQLVTVFASALEAAKTKTSMTLAIG
ncbi:hypothetical protein QTV43_000503 [Vibrio vulnificus]|nr:hypothetical protein [Vibrio vulnificus]